jgi:hypothetical protein
MKVFIIHCGNAPRKEKMIEQLEEHNITDYEFFGSIKHGSNYTLDELLEICGKEGLLFEPRKGSKDINVFKNLLSSGLNHYYAWCKGLKEGLDKFIVMEDDIEILGNLDIEIPSDCNIFYYYSIHNKNKLKEGINLATKILLGIQCYQIVNPAKVIEEVRKNSNTDAIDRMMGFCKCLKGRKYFIYPYLVDTDLCRKKSLVIQ